MARVQPIEVKLWSDPDFAQLSSDARLLYVWACSNQQVGLAGIYHASLRQMQTAIGTGARGRVESALERLERRPWLRYDRDGEVLWVVDLAERASASPKTRVAILRQWEACPPSLLKVAFARRYEGLLDAAGRV